MKLKTLKDLENDPKSETSFLTMSNIRNEAVKWVKFYRMEKLIFDEEAFKKFHNITEEDLK